jgi:predicted PurR-regulated permease PerM
LSDSQRWLLLAGLALCAWLVYLLAPILTPFVAGALLAYLNDPLADRLEALGLKRQNAVIVVFLTVAVVAILTLVFLLPLLESQVSRLLDNLPVLASWIKATVLPWLHNRFGVRVKWGGGLDQVSTLLGSYWQEAGGVAASLVKSLSHSGAVVLTWLMNVLLIPVVTFYLLRDWDLLVARVHDLLPRRWAAPVETLAREADEVLSAFLRGQFSVMLALGAIYSIGLWLVGLELGLLLGMTAGLVSFVPYLGAAVGVVSASVAAVSQMGDLWAALPVLGVFAVGHALEGMVLTPWMVGDKIGLHPVAVIFAVLAGGQLFGFLGVLLALPAASVAMVLLRHAHGLYKDSELYGEGERAEAAKKEQPELAG